MLLAFLSIATILGPGCIAPSKPQLTALEGSWVGREVTPGREGPATLTVSGHHLDFLGANSDEWLKGTFILRENTNPKQFIGVVTDCAAPQYVGLKSYSIFTIENETLTLTGSELGITNFPASFDAPDARRFVFKRDQ